MKTMVWLTASFGSLTCLLSTSSRRKWGGDALLEFVSPEFGARAEDAYESLAVSELTFRNVWEVFQALLPLVFPPDCELD